MARTRDPLLIAAALTLLCTAVLCTVQALSWVGQPYPGFLVLENGVVASAGLPSWPAVQGGEIYQYEIVSIDGEPLDPSLSPGAAVARVVQQRPPGTPLRYEMRKGDHRIARRIVSKVFTRSDFWLLYGSLLFCGLGLGGVALAIRFLRGNDAVAYGTFIPLGIVGLWALTALDLYGPYRLFRVHALCETFLVAAMVHMAMAFPSPWRPIERHPQLIWLPYAASALLAVFNQAGLYSADEYVATHLVATSLFGVGLTALVASQVARYVWSPSYETRQRVKVLALGTAAALVPQVVVLAWSAVTGGRAPHNMITFTGFLFPLAVGYAVLRHNLMDVDELVRRSLHYVMLSLVVAAAYLGCLTAFDALFQDSELQHSSGFALFFGVFSVVVLIPLRDGLQKVVNRAFYRTTYDFARTIEGASHRMAAATDLSVVASELTSVVGGALHPQWMALYLRRREIGDLEALEPAPLERAEVSYLLAACESSASPVEDGRGTLALPFRVDGRLRAVLLLGRRRSGRPYTGDDRRLLQTLANQGAVAIQNALAMDELRKINHELEWRVTNRTRELNYALGELREKNQMLTHLSTTDAVTNLRNRAFLDEAMRTEFSRARRYGSELSVLMVDIDYFKRVNDRYGHQVGDAVLRRVGELISVNLRSSDVAGRYGGEEFLVVLAQNSPGAGGLFFAERLRGSVEQEEFHDLDGRLFQITLSVGVASLQPRHRSAEELVGEADAALYRAKSNGRNRVESQVKVP